MLSWCQSSIYTRSSGYNKNKTTNNNDDATIESLNTANYTLEDQFLGACNITAPLARQVDRFFDELEFEHEHLIDLEMMEEDETFFSSVNSQY